MSPNERLTAAQLARHTAALIRGNKHRVSAYHREREEDRARTLEKFARILEGETPFEAYDIEEYHVFDMEHDPTPTVPPPVLPEEDE